MIKNWLPRSDLLCKKIFNAVLHHRSYPNSPGTEINQSNSLESLITCVETLDLLPYCSCASGKREADNQMDAMATSVDLEDHHQELNSHNIRPFSSCADISAPKASDTDGSRYDQNKILERMIDILSRQDYNPEMLSDIKVEVEDSTPEMFPIAPLSLEFPLQCEENILEKRSAPFNIVTDNYNEKDLSTAIIRDENNYINIEHAIPYGSNYWPCLVENRKNVRLRDESHAKLLIIRHPDRKSHLITK